MGVAAVVLVVAAVVAAVVVLVVPVLAARAAQALVEVPVLPAIEVVPVVVAQVSPRHMVVEGTIQIHPQINNPVLQAIPLALLATLHLPVVPVVDYPPHTQGTLLFLIARTYPGDDPPPSHPLTQNALKTIKSS